MLVWKRRHGLLFVGVLARSTGVSAVSLRVLEEVSHEMRFWKIADARNLMFCHTKCVPERR